MIPSGPTLSRGGLLLLSLLCASCGHYRGEGASYLYVWVGDDDRKESDFIAVFDADPSSDGYGDVINTVPVGLTGSLPHHTEYELPPPGEFLFANAHEAEVVLMLDLEDAVRPRVAGTLTTVSPLRYPHDIVRMPDGHVLVGYLRSEGPSPVPGDSTIPGGPGGIAEFTAGGELIRWASAADSTIEEPVRPYSFVMIPAIDRLVSTSAPMMEESSADVVQIWRLSTLELLHTLSVPEARLPDGRPLVTEVRDQLQPTGHRFPFVPRLMSDGSVLLNAFGCAFYRVSDLASDEPNIANVFTIEVPAEAGLGACGIPVVVGRFWVMTVGSRSELVVLDVTDPSDPTEAARLATEDGFAPHWLARDPLAPRLIVGAENGGEDRMLIAWLNPETGELSWDATLRKRHGFPGIDFRRTSWPHGETGRGFGHAALFRP